MAVGLIGQNIMLIETPFDGEGVSLYADSGTAVKYRRTMYLRGCSLGKKSFGGVMAIPLVSRLRSEEDLDVPLPRTLRVGFAASPTEEIDYTVPGAWYPGNVALALRTFKDGIENEDVAVKVVTLNASGEFDASLAGTAVLLSKEQRDGGVVRIRFSWVNTGTLTPTSIKLIRTAGPTSPADQTYAYVGDGVYEIDTTALSDASAYTFKIQMVVASPSTTLDVLTGISITADATGPTAPTGTAEAW